MQRQRERLWEFINARVSDGTSVVFATHDTAEAQRYAAQLLVLADGQALFTGAPAELGAAQHEFDLERAFVAFLAERGH